MSRGAIAAMLLVSGAILACSSTPTFSKNVKRSAEQMHALFAAHDCCGRLANSKITRLGEVHSGSHVLTIYVLRFINPESHHGMLNLAIVEGQRFVGSYATDLFTVPKVKGDGVRFACDPQDSIANDASENQDLTFDDGAPPNQLLICGEIAGLGDSV